MKITTGQDDQGFWAKMHDGLIIDIFSYSKISVKRAEVNEWCQSRFGDRWHIGDYNNVHYFKTETERTLFMVKWS